MSCPGMFSTTTTPLTILTISDHLFKEGQLTPEQRQTGFGQMMEIALKTAAAEDGH